jgi:outer membrane protein
MNFLKTLLATAVVVSAVPAMAYEAGDIMVKAGAVTVSPKSDPVSVNKAVEIESDTQLGLTLTYMVAPQVGIEVLAATPFKHEIKAGSTTLATTKHLPPTVSVQYYPLPAESAVQPYVGLGLNHTFFFDEDGAIPHLDKSTGLAYSIGVNYDINEQYLLNVALWKMDIDTKINGGTLDGADVQIDPTVFFIGAGYKF